MDTTFRTIASPSQGEYIEKKSKFLAYAYPVGYENDIKYSLDEIKKLHPTAKHICYAYRIGAKKDIWKANDAGEPNNTAGQPILGQIKSLDLTNIIVIVVRYFGGIKLGVGGLVTAYKEVAHLALMNALIIEDFEKEEVIFEVPFSGLSKAEYFLKKEGIVIKEQTFSETCRFIVIVNKKNISTFVKALNALPGITLLP